MPFGSTFTVYKMGISIDELPMIYMITRHKTMIAGPFIGKLSDVVGKFKVFFWGSVLS